MTNIQTDYQKKEQVELKKNILSVLLVTEKQPIILNNADLVELYFIEDIFKFCMMGSITFNDRYNLLQFGPFTGNEKIVLIYSIESKIRELVFDIWKVGRIQGIGTGVREESENIITIQFVDPFYNGYSLRKYSRSWSDKHYSDIMKDILNNMVFFKNANGTFNIEKSQNKTDFIIPYWNPVTAMRWLMRRAIGEQTGTSGYLCFNNTDKTFSHNLVSFNYLLSDLGRTIDPVSYVFDKGEISAENKILEWWINGLDRNSNSILRGGTWKGYDFSTKKLLNYEQVYSFAADNTICLGRKTLYPQIDDLLSSNTLIGDNNNDILQSIAYNDWAKRYNMQFILNIVVEGHEKRYAGQQINIEWTTGPRKLGSLAQYNDLFKGKYLIKSVTHTFSPGSTYPYRQRLVLIKNGYTDIDSKVLYKAKNQNLFNEATVKKEILRK